MCKFVKLHFCCTIYTKLIAKIYLYFCVFIDVIKVRNLLSFENSNKCKNDRKCSGICEFVIQNFFILHRMCKNISQIYPKKQIFAQICKILPKYSKLIDCIQVGYYIDLYETIFLSNMRNNIILLCKNMYTILENLACVIVAQWSN